MCIISPGLAVMGLKLEYYYVPCYLPSYQSFQAKKYDLLSYLKYDLLELIIWL